MHTQAGVIIWLEAVAQAFQDSVATRLPPREPIKRKRPAYTHPLSPSSLSDHSSFMSAYDAAAQHTPKRRKTHARLDDDPNETPRAPSRSLGSLGSHRDDDLSISSASIVSDHSGRSSPSKQLARLGINPAGLEIRDFVPGDERLPKSAGALVNRMQDIADGEGVVDHALQGLVGDKKKGSEEFRSFRPHVFKAGKTEGDGDPDPAGSLTRAKRLLEDLEEILLQASRCKEADQDEHGWNNLVHTPMLSAVMRYKSRPDIGFMPCATAGITARYKIDATASSRVDYVMFLDPAHSLEAGTSSEKEAVETAVIHLQSTNAAISVNHTPFNPLRRLPISVSIETKRYGEGEKKAEYQLGVWLAAQWRFLAEQVTRFTDTGGDKRDLEETEGQQERASPYNKGAKSGAESHRTLFGLDFLPGILVQGHEWKLVMATCDRKGKTLLWSSKTFGSTQSLLDMFKVVAGLAEMMRWSRQYARWFKAHVLRT